MPYTIFGHSAWNDYEVNADVFIEKEGSAGIMGRVNATGTGYGSQPNAYYLTLSEHGNLNLYVVTEDRKVPAKLLTSAKVDKPAVNRWRKLSLQFSGDTIRGFIDNQQLLQVNDNTYTHGMAGLMALDENIKRTTAQFDNLKVNAIGKSNTTPRTLPKGFRPIYH